MSEQNTNKDIKRYKWEYNNFLEFVKKRKVERAVIYAKALGIDRKTFVHWLSQPEMKDAMVTAIDELVDGMQRAGKNDWRMYRELMEIMGIDKEQKLDITSGGESVKPILGGLSVHSNNGNKENSKT